MTTVIHARDEDGLRNGSFYRQSIGKKSSTFSHYVNGDFMGWVQKIPAGLKTWSLREAKKLIPSQG